MVIARGLHPAAKVAEYQRRGMWTDETIVQLFERQVRTRPAATAIVDPANREALLGSTPRRLSWEQLDGEVTQLAARLLDLGLRRGAVVGVQLPNSIELVEVYLAAWSIGAVVSPLPMQYRDYEIATMSRQAEFGVFITCTAFGRTPPAIDFATACPTIPHVIAYERGTVAALPSAQFVRLPDTAVSIAPAPASDSDRAELSAYQAADPNNPNDCVTICWTSGTESTPKGVLRTHLDWLAISWATVDGPRLDE